MADSIIYIVGASTNPVKVGLASNMAARLQMLQTGCPDTLIVHRTHRVDRAFAKTVESRAHIILAPHHRRGEWFNVDVEAASAAVELAVSKTIYERRHELLKPANVVRRLSAIYGLHDAADTVLNFYRSINAGPDAGRHRQPYDLAMDSAGGVGTFEIFHEVVLSKVAAEKVAARQGVIVGLIEYRLVKAINAMAELYVSLGSPVTVNDRSIAA